MALLLGGLLYLGWALHVTWPLVQDPNHSVLGAIGDQTGGIAYMREWIQSGNFPFAPGTVHDLDAPFGRPLDWGVNLAGWVTTLPQWLLALAFGSFAASALITIVGFVLTGLVMQIFVTRLTGNRLAGIVCGFAYAFFPYAVMKSATHPPLGQGWTLALLAWRMWEVAQAPTRRNIAFACAATVLALGFSPYFLLFAGVLLATCILLALVLAWRRGRLRPQLGGQVAIAGFAVLYVGVLAVVSLGAGGGALRQHPESEFVAFGARLYEYVVPFARGHLFGDSTLSFLTGHQHGSNFSETTLYLGVVVLVLALVGVIGAARRSAPPALRTAALAAGVVALVGFWWSLPPHAHVLGAAVPAPIALLEHFTTTWRVMSRFVIVVALGVIVLAGIGLTLLMRGRSPWLRAALALVALGLIMLDFSWRPGVTPLGQPPAVYSALGHLPGGSFARYPLLPAGYGDNSELLWQDAAHHPEVNGYPEGSDDETRAFSLYYLDEPETARGLASLGVSYILVPADPSLGGATMNPGRPPRRGFRLVQKLPDPFTPTGIYRVTARPDLGYAFLAAGGSRYSERAPYRVFRYITEATARYDIDAPLCGARCAGRFRVTLSSFAIPRLVTLRAADGSVVWRGRVGTGRREVSAALPPFARKTTVTVESLPGPTPVQSVSPGNADQRNLALAASEPRFTR